MLCLIRHGAYFVCLFLCAGFLTAAEIQFGFESGDLAKEGWKIVEGTNTKPIGNRTAEFHNNSIVYQKQGTFYLTTLEQAGSDAPTDDPMCVMESPVFRIEGNTMKFLVGGGQRPKTYIALCLLQDDGTDSEVLKAAGKNTQGLDEVVWDVSKYIGKDAFFRVVDWETGSWAHIRADDFRLEGKIDKAKTKLREEYLRRLAEKKLAEIKAKTEAARKNPLLLAQPILYVTRPQYLPDHHNTATMFQTGEINTDSFRGGSAMKLWNPATGQTQTLLELPDGIVRDPCVSFDAKKILVSIRKSKEDDYHIYEYEVDLTCPTITIHGADSNEQVAKLAGLTQLTFGGGLSDIDPLYLPSGEILFSSTREPKYCMCNRHIMCNLFTMNPDGSRMQQIGHSTLFEGHASLLSDGRVVYDRWEYVDRNFGDAQGVWMTNPDGTNHAIYWGNNTNSPGGVLDTRVLPGSDSMFLCTFSSCHDRPWGAIALVDRRKGIDGKEPVLQTWPSSAIDLVGVGNYDTFISVGQKFEDPYPLSDSFFLASGMVGRGEEMGIYLLDRDGNIALLHEDAPGCFDPVPLTPTEAPPVIASRIDPDTPEGYFYVSNVYEGFGMNKVKPGSIKYLRVVESPEKRFWTHTACDQGNGTQAPGMAWDDFNNKRILGTVDVEQDGSVFFALPADTFVYLQLLDENGMMVQSMRSGTMVRPGETNGCFGCHENRLETPPKLSYNPTAMSKPPQQLRPWYGEKRLFSYLWEVQPVFDKYCVACHDFDGPGGQSLVLAGDRNLLFNASYHELRTKGYVNVPGAGPHTKLEPLHWGSNASKLAEILKHGHADPDVERKRTEMNLKLNRDTDREAFDRIITWMDLNAPYYPVYASAYRDNRFGRSPLSDAQIKRLAELTGTDPVWTVSLDRPEKSPALQKTDKNSEAYREALAILEQGKANLARQDRGENPDFRPIDSIEIEQEKKYEKFYGDLRKK